MKFSKDLLDNQEIGRKIFLKSVEKTKEFLKDVFGLDFSRKDLRIKEIVKNDDLNTFIVIFNYKDRFITSILNYQFENDNTVKETLSINEIFESIVEMELIEKDYQNALNKAIDFLESKYNINFIMLDPDEKDTNIININENKLDGIFEVIFKCENKESALFKATFYHEKEGVSSLKIDEYMNHLIIFD